MFRLHGTVLRASAFVVATVLAAMAWGEPCAAQQSVRPVLLYDKRDPLCVAVADYLGAEGGQAGTARDLHFVQWTRAPSPFPTNRPDWAANAYSQLTNPDRVLYRRVWVHGDREWVTHDLFLIPGTELPDPNALPYSTRVSMGGRPGELRHHFLRLPDLDLYRNTKGGVPRKGAGLEDAFTFDRSLYFLSRPTKTIHSEARGQGEFIVYASGNGSAIDRCYFVSPDNNITRDVLQIYRRSPYGREK